MLDAGADENAGGQIPILIIEDELDIRKFLRLTLETHGFCPIEAGRLREGLQLLTLRRPEAIILDLGLPDGDGLEFITTVRAFSQTPILVLSARGREADKILALDLGADDYLTKPFSAGEFIARIKVARRHGARLNGDGNACMVFESLGLRLDYAQRKITLHGAAVRLTPIEYKLLALLTQNSGRVLTHGQLLRAVWGKHGADNPHYLRIHMQHLREKLHDDALAPRYIFTEPGTGYRFVG